MKISHCRLLRKAQLRLLEFFVLEVTARSVANILGIQPNSAVLFYRKIREVIAYHLEQESHEIFDGIVWSWMRATLVVSAKVNVIVELQVRLLYSAY